VRLPLPSRPCYLENFAYEIEYRMTLIAVFALNVAHPGPVFSSQARRAIVDSELKTSRV
jgi:hypothetical protein